MARFVLVHPPLLGPAVWQPCARALRRMGADAVVPDLRRCVDPAARWWERYGAVVRPLVDGDTTVVLHSGAGVAAPELAAGAEHVVFVDAVVPAASGESAPSSDIRRFVAALQPGSHLPVWSDWWPSEVVAALVEDQAVLQAILAEEPRLAADFYDYSVPVAPRWAEGVGVHYVQFSAAYDAVAADCAARGWSVTRFEGTHLAQADRPADVARLLLSLVGRV